MTATASRPMIMVLASMGGSCRDFKRVPAPTECHLGLGSKRGLDAQLDATVHHLTNLHGKIVQCEWLGQLRDARIEHAVMDDGIARVASGVEHLSWGLTFSAASASCRPFMPGITMSVNSRFDARPRSLSGTWIRPAIWRSNM